MSQIQAIYIQFLSNFPAGATPIVSLVLVALIVYSIFKVVKKDFIFLIILVILLPSSIPILESVWQGIVEFIKFLLNTK